jgi:hypothetical protein
MWKVDARYDSAVPQSTQRASAMIVVLLPCQSPISNASMRGSAMKRHHVLTLVLSLGLAQSAIAAVGNDAVLTCDRAESTYAKDKCKKAERGKRYIFDGSIEDIRDEHTLHVKLDSDNYADVVFKRAIAEGVHVGQSITFKGRIIALNTGILISHDIDDAVLQ